MSDSVNLHLHPDAAASFSSRAQAFLARLQPRPDAKKGQPQFVPRLHPSARLARDDLVGDIAISTVDSFGRELGRYFEEGLGEVGLYGDDYEEFEKLTESVQRTVQFRSTVSTNRLKDAAFDWLKEARRGVTKATFPEYLVEVCSKEIDDYEIAVPIALLSIECPVPVGRAVIQPTTKDVIDQWFRPLQEAATPDQKLALEGTLEAKRAKLQGYSAALVKVRAEKIRAQEIAIDEADAACSLLRFFSPASLTPRLTSYCTPLGKENIQTVQAITFIRGGVRTAWYHGCVNQQDSHWVLSAAQISDIRSSNLDALSEIYRNPTTRFQERITDAVILYARVSVATELSDKLVLLMAALESLLLKDANEPVQQNLGERLSFIAGKNLQERREIVQITRHAYGLRSRFLHHAQEINDLDLMERFMQLAWRGIFGVISNCKNVPTLERFLDKIDDLKLS